MKAIIEVHHVYCDPRLDEILAVVREMKIQGESIKAMITTAEQAIIDQFNADTTAIGNRIAALVANAPTDNPDFLAALTAEADALKALGATPAAPVTAPVETPHPDA